MASKSYLNNTNALDEPTNLQVRDAEIYSDGPLTDKARRLGLKTDSSGRMTIGGFVITRTGLQVNGEIEESDWTRAVEITCDLGKSIQWILGDLLDLGKERQYKIAYETVAEKTGYEIQALRDMVYVCHNVELSVRTDKLKFGHHKLVAALRIDDETPDVELQRYWLEKAVVGKLTISQMREAMTPKPPTLSKKMQFANELQASTHHLVVLIQELKEEGETSPREILGMIEELQVALEALKKSWVGRGDV